MKTTYTEHFEKGFLHGLAGVSRRRSRKQVLQNIVEEAEKAVDMAKGLQGRGDWHGAAAKVVNSAGLLDQAIDLAETLPGVNFERTRKQAKLVISRLGKATSSLDVDPLDAREQVRACEVAIAKAVEAIRIFANRLNDDIVVKDGEKIDFDEGEIIKEVDKIMITGRSAAGPGAARRQRIGQQSGVFETGEGGSGWENVPGKAGRQRRKKGDGTYEYRDAPSAVVSASVDDDDVQKLEESDEDTPEDDEGVDEESEVSEEEKCALAPKESPEMKSLDPDVLLEQTDILGHLAKAKKGKKVKPGSLKGGKSEPAADAPAGEGKRFDALVQDLKNKGIDLDEMEKAAVRDPAALAAAIGRAKYGSARFQEMAAAGRRKKDKKK